MPSIKPPTESQIQQQCLKWLKLQHPQLLAVHIPNGVKLANGFRSFGKLKAEGVKAGFPDLAIYGPNGKHILIEMKRGKLGKLSENQVKMHKQLFDLGHAPLVASSFEQFQMIINLTFNPNL
jgi:hypothetical protein